MGTAIFADLQRGNTRFWTGQASRPEASFFDRRALLNKQFPSVAVLACADSRVPTEMVFDQGLGDLFVVRVAGNGLDIAAQGSLQFAVNGLKKLKDPRALDREAVTCNVKRQVETLCQDKSIVGKVRSEELLVVGGFYELSSGIVDFFSQKFG